MARIVAVIGMALLLGGCGAGRTPPPRAAEVRVQTVDRVVRAPCLDAADVPVPPVPPGAMPRDARAALDVAVAKLVELFGAGGYVARADRALRACAR